MAAITLEGAALTVASRPYAWPWHGRLSPRRTALVLFAGDRGIAPSLELAAKWTAFATALRGSGVAIVASPAMAAPEAVPAAVEPIAWVPRPHFGGFTGCDLDAALRALRVTDLLIAGSPFELGADCTMREANDLGYECLALEDLCEGMSDETLAGAMSSIQMSGGIFGAVATSAAVLAALAALPPLETDR